MWVNNAGVGVLGRFEEVPLADHLQVSETDLLGTLYGSYFALRQFLQQQSDTLINIASALGKIPAPYYASYTAVKYGVVGLSGALRQELKENHIERIHVCTVMSMATDPEDEVIVGAAGKAAVFAHNVAPGLTEKVMGTQTQRAQIEESRPAENTPGSLHEPSTKGTEVSGGQLKK